MLTGLVQRPTSDSSGAVDPAEVTAETAPVDDGLPPIVSEELHLLDVVLRKLDGGTRKTRIHVDDASALIELRDALAEAKPEDQGSILEQMHRIEALSKQRGKGDTPPVDRKSPYFGHLRLEESGKRRDVLIGARSFVEPGSGVQIVDWRNAPVSRLFYRYEEGDGYEERLGDRLVEGEILARRTVAIVDAELRRVASPQGTFSRDLRTGAWREIATRTAKLQIARDGSAAEIVGGGQRPAAAPPSAAPRGKLGLEDSAGRRPDRHLPPGPGLHVARVRPLRGGHPAQLRLDDGHRAPGQDLALDQAVAQALLVAVALLVAIKEARHRRVSPVDDLHAAARLDEGPRPDEHVAPPAVLLQPQVAEVG